MKRVPLFITACFLGGLGGFLGSALGGALGKTALFVGGFLGGVVISPLTARIATWRGWITPDRYWATALGAAVGFIGAATVAVNTLSSPVGPVLSVTLVGIGALIGARARTGGSSGATKVFGDPR